MYQVYLCSVYIFLVPTLPPRNITVNGVTTTTIAMSWLPPLQEGLNGPIRGYYVLVYGIDRDDNFTVFVNSKNVTITNLHPFYSYKFSVAAVTTSRGPSSEPAIVKMLESGKYLCIQI